MLGTVLNNSSLQIEPLTLDGRPPRFAGPPPFGDNSTGLRAVPDCPALLDANPDTMESLFAANFDLVVWSW